jgi:hypothetical protein
MKSIVIPITDGLKSLCLMGHIYAMKKYKLCPVYFEIEKDHDKAIKRRFNKSCKEYNCQVLTVPINEFVNTWDKELSGDLLMMTLLTRYAQEINADIALSYCIEDDNPSLGAVFGKGIYQFSNKQIKVLNPFIRMNLEQIIADGLDNNVPFNNAWSCSTKFARPICTTCDKCVARRVAFIKNRIQDPLDPKPPTNLPKITHVDHYEIEEQVGRHKLETGDQIPIENRPSDAMTNDDRPAYSETKGE